jgi:hypothetical protein
MLFGWGTRTALALWGCHPSPGPLRGEPLQYSEFGETAELATLRQPPLLIPNSSVLRARGSDRVATPQHQRRTLSMCLGCA